jgi:hypothetical protein
VQHKQVVAMALGGALVVSGATAVIAAVGFAISNSSNESSFWFGPLLVGGVLLLVGGLYPLIAVPIFGAPFPEPRDIPVWHGWARHVPFYRPPPSPPVSFQEQVSWRGSEVAAEVTFSTDARPGLRPIALPMETRVPSRLDLEKPKRRTIKPGDLPVRIAGKHGDIQVKAFMVGGIVIDECGSRGVLIRGVVYW